MTYFEGKANCATCECQSLSIHKWLFDLLTSLFRIDMSLLHDISVAEFGQCLCCRMCFISKFASVCTQVSTYLAVSNILCAWLEPGNRLIENHRQSGRTNTGTAGANILHRLRRMRMCICFVIPMAFVFTVDEKWNGIDHILEFTHLFWRYHQWKKICINREPTLKHWK